MEIKNEVAKKKPGRPPKAKPAATAEDFAPDRKAFGRQKRINFDDIIEASHNEEKTFCIINNSPRGELQRVQKTGWRFYEQQDLDSHFIDPDAMDNNRTQSKYASVPVGTSPDGEPMKAYLMYMPTKLYKETILKWHQEAAQAQKNTINGDMGGVTPLKAGMIGKITENAVETVSEKSLCFDKVIWYKRTM